MSTSNVYFDLGQARRVSHALSQAFRDAGSTFKFGIKPHHGSNKESTVLYATDGTTQAIWCEDDTVFSGTKPLDVYEISPALLGPGILGNDAFLTIDADYVEFSVDKTISKALTSNVGCRMRTSNTMQVQNPTGASPSKVIYFSRLKESSVITAFLASLGMLYGFGDEPGMAFHRDKVMGITTGDKPGMFDGLLTAQTMDSGNEGVFYKFSRAFCYVVVNMLLAAKVNETPEDVVVGIYDQTAAGGDVTALVQCGPCCIYTDVVEAKKPSWNTYMPIAFADQVGIPQPEAALVFSAAASTLFSKEPTSQKPVTLVHRSGQGLTVMLPDIGLHMYSDVDMDTFPDFSLELTKNQIVALSYAIGAAQEGTPVNFILGEDDELLVSMDITDSWLIRLK